MSSLIEWHSEDDLKANVEDSRKNYDLIEKDLVTCFDFVELSKDHFSVYSNKFSDIIIRIGPEILRVFDLIIFNKKICRLFKEQTQLEPKIVGIQEKKAMDKEGFMDYLDALPKIKTETIKVRKIDEDITPFEVQKTWIIRKQKYYYWIDWWNHGYNALKHKKNKSFKEAATLKNALFSLAGLFVLHERLDRDHGRKELFKSQVFKIKNSTPKQ